MRDHYTIPWWLRNGHMQTCWPQFFRPTLPAQLKKASFIADDGERVQTVVYRRGNDAMLVILPGLEGSVKSHYVATLLNAARQQNWSAVVLHHRGCGDPVNCLPRRYHGGFTADLNRLVRDLKARQPKRDIFVVGISLGGNMVLKWLGETPAAAQWVRAAAAISVPFDLAKSVHQLQQGISRVYDRFYFIPSLKYGVRQKFSAQTPYFSFRDSQHVKSVWEFDEAVTAPLHGFENASAYYKYASCSQFIPHIRLPTYILHAKDDPFVPADCIPDKENLPSSVSLEVREIGGHVGFIGQYKRRIGSVMPEAVTRFFQKVQREERERHNRRE